MNLLDELEAKVALLGEHPTRAGFVSVVRHLEEAQRHYEAGRGDDQERFTDSVYRTNQAYEGALRETWGVVGDGRKKLRTVDLENELVDGDFLSERAKKLVELYRQEWRNPHAHEHRLRANEQDAFLGMVNILGATSVLLDQAIERLAKDATTVEVDVGDPGEEFHSRLARALEEFAEDRANLERVPDGPLRPFAEVMGRLTAVLEANFPDAVISREVSLGAFATADLYIRDGGSSAVVEVITSDPRAGHYQSAHAEMLRILEAQSSLGAAFVLFLPRNRTKMASWVDIFRLGEAMRAITVVGPEGAQPKMDRGGAT
jgi:hypothetical protein